MAPDATSAGDAAGAPWRHLWTGGAWGRLWMGRRRRDQAEAAFAGADELDVEDDDVLLDDDGVLDEDDVVEDDFEPRESVR